MSVVTDIILVTMIDDGGAEDEFPNVDSLRDFFVKVDGNAGGNKAMQCDVFMAAVNHLDQKGLIDDFRKIDWEWPESAQLMLKGEDDDAFTIYTPNDLNQGRENETTK